MGRASGRKSRLARRPGPIDNRGDLDRVESAAAELLRQFQSDVRIGALYTSWCHGRELPRLMTHPVSDLFPDAEAAAWRALLDAVLRPPSDMEVAYVREVLDGWAPGRRWPRRWATWVLLNKVWPAAFYTAIQRPDLTEPLLLTIYDNGDVRMTYGADTSPAPPGAIRRGYRPQAKGHEKIREAVQVWYQAYMQETPAPIPELTKKYAEREKRLTAAHSVVYDRIELAETLLNRLESE